MSCPLREGACLGWSIDQHDRLKRGYKTYAFRMDKLKSVSNGGVNI